MPIPSISSVWPTHGKCSTIEFALNRWDQSCYLISETRSFIVDDFQRPTTVDHLHFGAILWIRREDFPCNSGADRSVLNCRASSVEEAWSLDRLRLLGSALRTSGNRRHWYNFIRMMVDGWKMNHVGHLVRLWEAMKVLASGLSWVDSLGSFILSQRVSTRPWFETLGDMPKCRSYRCSFIRCGFLFQ